MTKVILRIGVASIVMALCPHSSMAETITPDLKAVSEGKGWKGSIAATTLVEKDGMAAVQFDKRAQNVVWLDGFDFRDGTIEFDAKGKSSPPQGSFIGVSFRTLDGETHDAVYFRPFNFKASDPGRKSHAVQYVSEPGWPWRRLRTEMPGVFEQPIDPAPDGDAWFHVKITVEDREVKVFVNGASQPSLAVKELSDRQGGSVGLWCNGYGIIANLKITPKK